MTPRLPVKRGASKGGRASGSDGGTPPHPLVRAIEQVYAAGATPRLVIDARRIDVVVPDFLRARWAERLVIDLDAAYPLDLVFDAAGVHASLAFSGIVSRCTFSWASIYRIVDRADGRGIVVPTHEPPVELPPELAYATGTSASASGRPLTEMVGTKKSALAAVPSGSSTSSAAPASSVSDDEAKARRAKFRVIEGG